MRKMFLLADLCLAFGLAAPRILFAESGLIFDQTQGMLTGQLNVSSNIVAAGSVTASSATFTNTAGAGLTVSSSAYLAVSGGNVGIGTTSTGAKLDVAGDLKAGSSRKLYYSGAGTLSIQANDGGGWANSYSFLGSAGTNVGGFGVLGSVDALTYLWAGNSYDNPTMVWKSGNVGIGTTAPGVSLDVSGGAESGTIRIGGDVNAATRTDAARKLGRLVGAHYTNNEEPVAMVLLDADAATSMLAIGGGGNATNAVTSISFLTAANTTTRTGTNRILIDSSGNVGIGTANPDNPLVVKSNSTATNTVPTIVTLAGATSGTAAAGFGAGLRYVLQDAGGDFIQTNFINSVWDDPSAANRYSRLDFYSGKQNGTYIAMSIDKDGNVGIGTANPGAKLDINGTLNAAGNFTGTTGSYSSYLTMGSLVVADPGAAYYGFGSRIGGTLGINGGVSIGAAGAPAPANGLIVGGNVGLGTTATPATIKHAVRTVQNGGLSIGTYYVKLFDNSADASPKLSFKMTSSAGSEYGAEVDVFIPSYVYYQPNNYGGWTNGIGPQITSRMGGLNGQPATFKNIHAVSAGNGDLQLWLEFYTDYTTRVISLSENPGSGAITWTGLTTSAPANIRKSVAFVTGAKNENGIVSRFDGNVGIGTTEPKTALDVNGLVRVGRYAAAGMPACNSDTLGSFAFDTTNDRPYTCASTGWKPLDSDYDKDGIVDWSDWDDHDANKKNINLIASNIKKGVEIFGVTGTFTGIPISCKAVLDSGYSTGDGTYLIDPNGGDAGDAFAVYCDMTADGGGWTILIRHPASATTQNPLSDYGTVSVSGNYSIWSKAASIPYEQMLYKPSYNANLWASATKGVNGWSAPVVLKYTDTNGTVYNYTSSERVFLSGGSVVYSVGCAGYTPNGAYGLVLMEFPPGAWCSHTGYGFGLSGGDMRGCHMDSWKWNWGGSPGDANQCPDPAQFKSGSVMVGIR